MNRIPPLRHTPARTLHPQRPSADWAVRWLAPALLLLAAAIGRADRAFDAAPFALPLEEGAGLLWEDPREIHRVVVWFKSAAPPPDTLRLQYWGSWWPERHLPKDREPGGGDMGWMELGNWYKSSWRTADTAVSAGEGAVVFTFAPVNAKEFPGVADYPARFRTTLKLRVVADGTLPPLRSLEAYTDSTLAERALRLAWREARPERTTFSVFNGTLLDYDGAESSQGRLRIETVTNSDPNTFDRTLVTVRRGADAFTFKVDDLAGGPLFLPHLGAAVLPDDDPRDYAAVAAAQQAHAGQSLYDRVAAQPEHTWAAAWAGMPPKKSHLYFPLGLDGGRQRFRVDADGSVRFRSNDGYLRARPGRDTPRLPLEGPNGHLDFALPGRPVARTLEDRSLPILITAWERDGIALQQTAFVTPLTGTIASGPAPAGDTFAVWLASFTFTNRTRTTQEVQFPVRLRTQGGGPVALRADADGRLWHGQALRAYAVGARPSRPTEEGLSWSFRLGPGEAASLILKVPYLPLIEPAETDALAKLDFAQERLAVAAYWGRRLDAGARLLTPEPMLDEFYRSHAMHLLVNCEREPGSDRRFARVGSFGYGAYGNESCMMVLDLERRGLHAEAQACLDGWLHYQGTVGLPGDFASQDGVLYGAGGYEAGGYNQHHGWILWMLAEHFRFTRDTAWLRRAAPGLLQGADWILRETARTADRHPLERGLLPAGSLEDIGDWWTWLSTSCYTWRGLDAAAWVLGQLPAPEAPRLRAAADAYRAALLANFREAARRAPVVRLRDGTAVPKFPSHVHRRGRSFGWITETLEGALHLLIAQALDPRSAEATWILKDYEDNLYLSNQYGYTLEPFESQWFSRGGMSMQACLLLGVEPFLYRDDVKHALRTLFNAQAASYFPDVRMNTEHALPELGDWRGDHFKSSDEANAAGWLRQLFLREDAEDLLVGQAIPRGWLGRGQRCGLQRGATWFGPVSIMYAGATDEIVASLAGPRRNPPRALRVRFRDAAGRPLASVLVNGEAWTDFRGEWVHLPGAIGDATVVARFGP